MDREANQENAITGMSRREAIKRSLAAGIAMSVAGPAFSQGAESTTEEPIMVVSKGPIVDLIQTFIDSTQTPGVAVSLFDGNASSSAKIFPVGTINLDTKAPVEPGVIFEIGSVTKTFTATLLGFRPDLFDEPLLNHLPVTVPNPLLRLIKIKYLATHTSGFPDTLSGVGAAGAVYLFGTATQEPELPPNNSAIYHLWESWYPTDPANTPCSSCQPGSCWLYSDVAFVTLGFVVGGVNYNGLLNTQITAPLGMTDTAIVPPAKATVAQGYNFDKKTHTPMKAPGVSTDLKSSAVDMITWLQAQLYPSKIKDSGLRQAIDRTHQIHFRRTDNCPSTMPLLFDMGLAWQFYDGTISKLPGEKVYTKNGASGMGGQSCWVAFLPARKLGIAVLTNLDHGTLGPGELGTKILQYQLGLIG
jgi:beta-lactamase class C